MRIIPSLLKTWATPPGKTWGTPRRSQVALTGATGALPAGDHGQIAMYTGTGGTRAVCQGSPRGRAYGIGSVLGAVLAGIALWKATARQKPAVGRWRQHSTRSGHGWVVCR